MAYSNGVISATEDNGITIMDICNALQTSSTDVGTLCSHKNVNKWAIYKPVNINKMGMVTLAERKAIHMGLQMDSIPELIDTGIGVAQASLESVRAAISEWSYAARTKPYRMSDFLCDVYVEGKGYSHPGYNRDAKPCDSDWHDLEQRSTTPKSVTFGNFSFRINEQTATNMGSANSNFMPLSFINDDLSNWYLGIAIYISNSEQSQTGWYFVSGQKSLGEVANALNPNPAEALPTLSTNQWLRDQMGDKNEFTCVPCILVNPQTKRIVEEAQRTYISMSNGKVYSMPSGQKDFKLRFNVAIKNAHVNAVNGGIGYVLQGSYSLPFACGQTSALYLIKGYVNGVGRTTGGWFLANPILGAAAYGYQIRQFVIVYCDIDDNNKFTFGTPPESLTIKRTLYYKYLTISSEQTMYGAVEHFDYRTIQTTIDKSATVTFTGSSGSDTFHGYVDRDFQQIGLSLKYATEDAY